MPVRTTVSIRLEAVLLCLTAATGIIDAVCYLGMGHVLVANMTGNIVFLGLALAGAKGFTISSFLVALGSFLIGATVGGRLGKLLDQHRRRWLATASAIQAGLAAAAALCCGRRAGPNWYRSPLGDRTSRCGHRRPERDDSPARHPGLDDVGSDDDDHRARRRLHARRGQTIRGETAGSNRSPPCSSARWSGALMVHVGFTQTLGFLAGVLALVAIGFAVVPEQDPQSEPEPMTSPQRAALSVPPIT